MKESAQIGQAQSNRRGHPRAPFRHRIQLRVGKGIFQGRISDISSGGVGLSRVDSLLADCANAITLFLPVPQRHSDKCRLFVVDGRVAWRTEDKIGIRFINIAEAAEQMIQGYVAAATDPWQRTKSA